MALTLVYAGEQIPQQINKSVFLAGPSLRSHNEGMISWREKAIQILETLEYDGIVFIPEGRGGIYPSSYDTQIHWETKCLNVADNILFYINRDVENDILGLTTNSEFGQWMESGKCVLATEPTADSVRYQEWWAKEIKVPAYHDMFNAIKFIMTEQGDGVYRTGGERFIPLEIWKLDQFQSWYKQVKLNGNTLEEARVLHVHRIPSNNKIFAYSIWASVFITKEERRKTNEFIFSRPDISSCLLYYWRPDPMECEVVLVSEFRTPVNNSKGLVYELPGGSSIKQGVDPRVTMTEELHEECGFDAKQDKLEFVSANQLASTMLTHKSHLYSYKLDRYELDAIKANVGKIFGNEQDTERTEIHVFRVADIIDADWIDWANLGQMLRVIMTAQ